MKNNGYTHLLILSVFILIPLKTILAEQNFTLTQILEQATTKSIPVIESGWDTENQKMMKDSVRDRIWPRINLENNLSYYSTGDDLAFNQNFKSYLQVNWSFMDFKSFYISNQFAQKALEASFKNLSETKRIACVKAIQLFYQFWKNEEKRLLSEKEMVLIKKQLRDSQFLYSKGNISKKDLEAAEEKVSTQQIALDTLLKEIKTTKTELGNFLMLKEAFALSKPPSDISPPALPDQQSMEQKALNNSSSYSTALEMKEETQNLIDNFTFRQYTQISSTLFFSNTLNMNEFDWNKEKKDFFYGMGVGWRIPLLNKGDKKRQLKQAEISLEKARTKIDSIPNEISQKLQNLYELYKEKNELIKAQKDSIQKEDLTFSVLKRKHKNGDLSEREFDSKTIEHERIRTELRSMEYEIIIIRAEIDLLCANTIYWLAGPLIEGTDTIPFQIIGAA